MDNYVTILKNPRKPNGDLGDITCSYCSCQTGVYILIEEICLNPDRICKGCLLKMVKMIDKAILQDLERKI